MKAKTTKQRERAQRATALLTKLIDIARRMDDAPSSPFSLYGPAKLRREMRRSAMRLRKGQMASRFENLFNAAQLADLCEQTARRNEMTASSNDTIRR